MTDRDIQLSHRARDMSYGTNPCHIRRSSVPDQPGGRWKQSTNTIRSGIRLARSQFDCHEHLHRPMSRSTWPATHIWMSAKSYPLEEICRDHVNGIRYDPPWSSHRKSRVFSEALGHPAAFLCPPLSEVARRLGLGRGKCRRRHSQRCEDASFHKRRIRLTRIRRDNMGSDHIHLKNGSPSVSRTCGNSQTEVYDIVVRPSLS